MLADGFKRSDRNNNFAIYVIVSNIKNIDIIKIDIESAVAIDDK
ncbi:hypothetical protein [Pectinatus sottacetonis]|nr:hypothetical protein [Pectinatus sottacetonis]